MPARLTFFFRDRPQQVVELSGEDGGDEFLLGRDPQCSIVLDDDRLSRRHARLCAQAGGWMLQDLGSKNGTVAAGRRVESTVLMKPTWISFGGRLARFEPLSSEQAASAALERLHRWQVSAELQRDLDPALGLDEVLRRLLRATQKVSGTERSFVLLAAPGEEMTVAATRGLTLMDLEDDEFTGSIGAVELALAEDRTVVLSDATTDPQLGGRPSILGGGIRTLICLPLHDGDRCLGVLYADAQQAAIDIDGLDVQILEALASHASLTIAVAQLSDETQRLGAAAQRREARQIPDWNGVEAPTWTELLTTHRGERETAP